MSRPPVLSREDVVRLWLHRQGLARPRATPLTKNRFVDHLERTGALQLDSVNAVDRAHYLTLWSRFGPYDRKKVDRWTYRDRVAFEYWGHEASIVPISRLPLSKRRMRGFPSDGWTRKTWWPRYNTSDASKRRVLARVRRDGPLESTALERRKGEKSGFIGETPEDKRSLKLLWHAGKLAIHERRHFRCVYDLAARIYPDSPMSSRREFADSWLLLGLQGNGVATEAHLNNYMTTPTLAAADRKTVIERALKKRTVREVRIEGVRGIAYALPEHLDAMSRLDPPEGTTLICPFDSLLWQRRRAKELLDFEYRVEIYVPAPKRVHGYYVLPIMHDGAFVGRLDPKLHREEGRLEIRALHFEPEFNRSKRFDRSLRAAVKDLAAFLDATKIDWP